MSFHQPPETPMSEHDALVMFRAYVEERQQAGVMLAEAFTRLELSEGTLTAAWDASTLGEEKSGIVLELNPWDNLAGWLGTPMCFDNEQGRQLRQHVKTISVIGPFGIQTLTAEELYVQGTGNPVDE